MIKNILLVFGAACIVSLFVQGKELKDQIDELNAKLTVHYMEMQEMKNESSR
jgi:hypothetical protein